MWIADNWKDYEIIDCSEGEKLERWGEYILLRPDPQVLWNTPKTNPAWKKLNGHYHRSNKGGGTLSYTVDDKGVAFEFDAPNTVDGDKALELVRRGDISGCSFAFTTHYYDSDFVERQSEVAPNGVNKITYRVKAVTGIYDFTLAVDPYYPDTSVEAREFAKELKREQTPEPDPKQEEKKAKMREQLREMRHAAKSSLVIV